jgi:4-hydroxy-tetrahydrodipicolinate synthase
MSYQTAKYITPAVTPLTADGAIDHASCKTLYRHLIEGGVDGILILGSIGEFFALTMDQKKELIQTAVQEVGGRIPLLAGTTSMVVDEIIELSRFALEAGVDGVMVIPPFYFHFTDDSIFEYYETLAEAIPGDLYLYNFPERTGYSISPQVVRRLAMKHRNIVGIKDTISGVDHTRELIRQVKSVRPEFQVYSGFDDNFAHNVLCGGDGCISGISNLYPELTSAWVQAVRCGDFEKVQSYQQKIDGLMDIYAISKPFVPIIKEAMVMEGIIQCAAATRPMPTLTEAQKQSLRELLGKH